ncbi:MAG: SIR2 family protein [Terracidiphilus sp.]
MNIDDLELAVARRFSLPRAVRSMSFSDSESIESSPVGTLEFVHLNGTLDEAPEGVTFSPIQYAQRLVSPDPVFRRVAAELVSSPFVFIGSPLEEPTLWQSIEARRRRGGRDQRELRPRSYLVSPNLPAAKRALLAEFNVVWLPMTAEQFSETVLTQLSDAATIGLAYIHASILSSPAGRRIPSVAELSVHPDLKTEYLLGSQPIWADIQSGRAVEREHDSEVWGQIERIRDSAGARGIVLVSGTSGSGKSTALMKAALRLSASGAEVGWVDPEEDLSPRDIRSFAGQQRGPFALVIDDADVYGSQLTPMLRELVAEENPAIVLIGIRSGRVDRFINSAVLEGSMLVETTVPLLTDGDIEQLIDVLTRENRQGILRGLPRKEQVALFREQSGRELLVAMIQATSGKKFTEKVIEEFLELSEEQARIYGLVAISSSFRFGLTSQDILIALADETNSSLNAIETLISRKLLRRGSDGSVFLRHRVIADVVRDYLQTNGFLSAILQGLASVAASRSVELRQSGSRARRILRSILNHDFLIRSLGLDSTRNLYGSLEEILSWDHHYWLQRGSFEVERGDLSLARNFLGQARGLSPDDPFVETEWAYLLFAQANENPTGSGAEQSVEDATAILEVQMSQPTRRDAYPFHVMGSQGLAWSRRGIHSTAGRIRYLREIQEYVERGVARFPSSRDLVQLRDDIQRESLSLTVVTARPLFP